jgi:hypothetical protein
MMSGLLGGAECSHHAGNPLDCLQSSNTGRRNKKGQESRESKREREREKERERDRGKREREREK